MEVDARIKQSWGQLNRFFINFWNKYSRIERLKELGVSDAIMEKEEREKIILGEKLIKIIRGKM